MFGFLANKPRLKNSLAMIQNIPDRVSSPVWQTIFALSVSPEINYFYIKK
ncbi:Uncharacterized protein dnm_014360 [Desulfonema magnum]|uniref:Uncharacterized protein n=1 Tax=Desulfonema magnum TaxID=45655 RepID=A0A975BHC5_9BACT|nr:Uncharacterized protein dnm_014360 [Desulfonema magnum]